MNELELRSLVRAAVARHLGQAAPAGVSREECEAPPQPVPLPLFTSHTIYTGLVNVGNACVIEPAVNCDHCGYCKSHGY